MSLPDIRGALCAEYLQGGGRDLWFGEDDDVYFTNSSKRVAEAKKICKECPVRDACLQLAISLVPLRSGIWGGHGAVEINRMMLGRKVICHRDGCWNSFRAKRDRWQYCSRECANIQNALNRQKVPSDIWFGILEEADN